MNPDVLLGWHVRPTQDALVYPVMFHVVKQGEACIHLMEAGYDVGPFFSYCIYAPLYGLPGRTGDDGTPLAIVCENFSMLMWAAAYGQPAGVKSLLQLGQRVCIPLRDPSLHLWNL